MSVESPGVREFHVEGMTCEHCVAAVRREIDALPETTALSVDLDSGTVRVAGPHVDEDAIRAAVEEAGYALA